MFSNMSDVPKILVFDSGLGGLTVFAEVVLLRPDARFFYAADDAGFPYGRLGETQLVERVMTVMARLIERIAPDVVVVACNTASTLVLPHLREAYPKLPFVGTVPAVKPAATQSRSQTRRHGTPFGVAAHARFSRHPDFESACPLGKWATAKSDISISALEEW